MNTHTGDNAGARVGPGLGGMSDQDLAEIIGAFNDVTTKLHGAHEALRSEVTRLKRELREANEEVERSRRLAALGEMAAGIAHEVRNPLGSIRLYARMLEQDLADRPAERTIAEKIGVAVRGLDAVVGDVLAFSKEMRVSRSPIDSDQLLRDAVQEGLGGVNSAIDVRVDVEVEEIEGDAALLHRALVNIVRNAGEAMAESGGGGGGRLEVRCDVGAMETDGGESACYAISVRDSGPGIPADVLPRMFNPFFTTRATGTGLGLSIVHRIVDAHGGRVVVKNMTRDDGTAGGALVQLLIPVVRESRDARDSRDARVARGSGHKRGRSGGGVEVELGSGASMGPVATEEVA